MPFFDSVSPLERVKLAKEVVEVNALIVAEQSSANPNKIRLITLGKRRIDLRTKLGATAPAMAVAKTASAPTVKYFPQEQRRTKGNRQKDNDAALDLLAVIRAENRPATEEEKAVLARFSGFGGNLFDKESGLYGSTYEYFTPPVVASGIWDALGEMGFSGGRVLDPSSGCGIFAATRPASAAIDQVELSSQSGSINSLVNDGPGCKTTISPFEAVAASTPDETYDAVVTNVPFGDNSSRGKLKELDKKWSHESLEYYFMLRSMDKLKPGGLAAFVVPPRIVSEKGGKMEELRYQLSLRSEFMGAYRLPNKIFQDASDADTIVDVVVFKKHSKEARQKINELAEQDITVLNSVNVLWEEFINGNYFKGEGRKFQFGEFTAKDPNKFRDVDRVVSDEKSTANIAKMMRKFPGSRIDWAALDATEAVMIEYKNGDVIYQDGKTLEYRDGTWVAREEAKPNAAIADVSASMGTALRAVNDGVTWDQAHQYVTEMRRVDRSGDLADWLILAHSTVSKASEGERGGWFNAVAAGMAAMDVRNSHAKEEPFDYSKAYPALTALIKTSASYANKTVSGWAKKAADSVKLLGVIFRRSRGFEARWEGRGAASIDAAELTQDQHFEKIRYEHADDFGFIPLSKLVEVYGEGFDPMTDDEWCVSEDGKSFIRAPEYFQGNYAKTLERIDLDIATCEDDAVKAKLLRMRLATDSHVIKPDVDRMNFNLHSPYLSMQQKLEFLQSQVNPHFFIETDDKTGESRISFPSSGKSYGLTEKQMRVYRRFALSYLQNGSVSTATGNLSKDEESALIQEIREVAASANAKINVWAKANPVVFGGIKARLLDPNNLEFRRFEDEAALAIAGVNPDFKPHGYQYAEIRRQGKKFGGINGFSVGLGKTATALISVQYAQSIGVKKKTVFVVPNTVLSNWKKEAVTGEGVKGEAGYKSPVYANGDDCLFVGLTTAKDGSAQVTAKQRDIDLNRILENKHSKIFMTVEAFVSIPMREETQQEYRDYIAAVDPSFATRQADLDNAATEKAEKKRKADQERAEGKQQLVTKTGEKSSLIPFFEDMGIDSIVIDEAHQGKNSKHLVDFKSAKFLSTGDPSQRGLDMQIKAWFVRKTTPQNDGVLALTATPITNSPLEIYSMLTLAVGEVEMNRRLGIKGADDFMNAFSTVENIEELDIVGRPKAGRVFLGLQNVQMLSDNLGQIANIKTPDDVGNAIALPEEIEVKTAVELDSKSKSRLITMQQIYIIARKIENEEQVEPEELDAITKYSLDSGEPITLLAHPFNLIGKMTDLILDPELESGLTIYKIGASEKKTAEGVIKAFNAKAKEEDRSNPGKWASANVIKKVIKTDTEDNSKKVVYKVTPQAWIDGDTIKIDSTDFKTIDAFGVLAEKAGLNLDVELSPKLAALIANVKKEQAAPKAGSIAKQIVFCDSLGMHHKIKRALVTKCGIAPAKIGIINAVAVSDPADMQDLQDGFNGLGEENRYQIIIANKKAEVGINLQIMTQAIHHLTIGWTPDSLTQRNGRGVRQGNKLRSVNTYYYDAGGTFDEYKRMLVNKKSDWIGAVMSNDSDSNSVRISGELSAKDKHDLIMAVGDDDATAKARIQIEKRERERQTAASREAQIQTMRIVEGQNDWLNNNPDPETYCLRYQNEHYKLQDTISKLKEKVTKARIALESGKGSPVTYDKLGLQLRNAEARMAELESMLKGSFVDSKGVPDQQSLGYYAWKIGEARTSSGMKLNENSQLYKNYMLERGACEKTLEVARKQYTEQAGRFGSYSSDTLEAFESGKGRIIGGVLVMAGMVGLHKNKYWIVKNTEKMIYPPTGEEIEVSSAVSGFEFIGPADADEDWFPVAEALARADEQTISEGNAKGFGIKDARLYATYSADIADRLTVSPAGVFLYPSSLAIKPPHFVRPLPPSRATDGDAFIKRILGEQKSLLEWEQDMVRVVDLKDQYEGNSHSININKGVIHYAAIHGLKITKRDVDTLYAAFYVEERRLFDTARDSRMDKISSFAKSLANALVTTKTHNDLMAWFKGYLSDTFPEFALDSGFDLEAVAGSGIYKQFQTAHDKLAAGGQDVIWFDKRLAINSYFKTQVASKIRYMIKENPAAWIADGKPTIETEEQLRAIVRPLIVDESKQFPNLRAVSLNTEFSEFTIKENSVGGGVVLCDSGFSFKVVQDELIRYKAEIDKILADRIAADLASESAGGLDIDDLLHKVFKVPGVSNVGILKQPVVRQAKYGNGSYIYQSLATVEVYTYGKSGRWSEFANKETGLEGRHWDQPGKRWLFTIADGEKTSNGTKVASVNDLLAFFGMMEEAA